VTLRIPSAAENFFDEQSVQSQTKAGIVADYFSAWACVIISVQKRPRSRWCRQFSGEIQHRPGN